MGDGSEIRNNLGDVYHMGPNWRILAWNAFLKRVTARLKRVSAVSTLHALAAVVSCANIMVILWLRWQTKASLNETAGR
jgi:hypothetical protein